MSKSMKLKKEEMEKQIEDATELFYINKLISHNKIQLANIRMDLKRLMKEQKLLFNIKKMIRK